MEAFFFPRYFFPMVFIIQQSYKLKGGNYRMQDHYANIFKMYLVTQFTVMYLCFIARMEKTALH